MANILKVLGLKLLKSSQLINCRTLFSVNPLLLLATCSLERFSMRALTSRLAKVTALPTFRPKQSIRAKRRIIGSSCLKAAESYIAHQIHPEWRFLYFLCREKDSKRNGFRNQFQSRPAACRSPPGRPTGHPSYMYSELRKNKAVYAVRHLIWFQKRFLI